MSSDWKAKVLIRRPDGWPGRGVPLWEVWIDGVEMASKILSDSLTVEFPSETEGAYAKVTLTLAADVELDLPDAHMGVTKEAK